MAPAAPVSAPAELFIYYRVPSQHAQALAVAVERMQSGLRARHPGLEARLLRRAEAADGDATWMEAYVLPPGADVEALSASIAEAADALRPWVAGERHVEHFVPCAS